MISLSRGLSFSLSTSLFWAITIVIQRLVLNKGENPLNLVFWSYLFSTPLWLFLLKRHLGEFRRLSKKNKSLLVFIGIAGSIGISYLQSLALKNTTAVNFSFLYRTIVIFTIVFAWIFFREKISTKKLFIVALILIGSYFLTTKGENIALGTGDIYTLLMAASAAFIANILTKHTTSKMHPDLSGAVTMLVSFLSLLCLSIATNSIRIPQELFLILLSSVFGFFQIRTRNKAYQIATASFVTMIVSLTPLFVSVISLPVLGEKMDAIQLLGGLLIVSSGFLAEKLKM